MKENISEVLKDVLDLLDSFDCIKNEDSLSKSFFKAELNEDSFYILCDRVRKLFSEVQE